MPRSEKSREIMESFKRARIQQKQGYRKRSSALAKQEELMREQAYPEPGKIHSQFSDIAAFDPEAAERLTAGEYDIRRLPYESTIRARKAAQAEEEELAAEQADIMEELEEKREAEAIEKEKDRVAGVKVRAQIELWRQKGMDETEIRLRLRKDNLLKHYVPPKTSGLDKKDGGTLQSVIDWLQDRFTGGA